MKTRLAILLLAFMTHLAFGQMGSGTGSFGTIGPGGSALNTNGFVIYTVGNSGAMFTDIQTALNAAFVADGTVTNGSPKGTVIQIGPGMFNSNGPSLNLSNTALHAIVIQGSGEISTAIHASNTVLKTVGNLGNTEGARFHLYVRDCALISDQNTTNPIVRFDEAAVRDFEHVYFSYNGFITNTQWGISTAPSIPDPVTYPKLVYGVQMANTDEECTRFKYCHFNGLADGIWGACAHLFVIECQFQLIGQYTGGTTNGWPKTDSRAIGGCVVIDNGSYEGHVENCSFVSVRAGVAMVNTIGGQYTVYNSYVEAGGLGLWLNDDTGAPLQIFNNNIPVTTRNVSAADFTATLGSQSVLTGEFGFFPDNIGLVNPPYWGLRWAGVNVLQLLTDGTSLQTAGAVSAGGVINGNGSGLTNSASVTATNFISGAFYTNNAKRTIFVSATAHVAVTNGGQGAQSGAGAWMSLYVDPAGGTSITSRSNRVGIATPNNGNPPPQTNDFFLGKSVPPGASYSFSNSSVGTGAQSMNQSSLLSGTGEINSEP